MPRVLRILNRFNLGGPTYNASYLSKHLPSEYETLLIGGEKDESEASSLHITDSLGLKPTIIKEMRRSVNFSKDRLAYKKIVQIIREFKPDIVHTHASKAGAIGRLAAINENIPTIVHTYHGHVFHGYFNPIKTKVYKFIETELAKRTHKIVAISNIQKQELSLEHKICSPEKIKVIPLGFDLDRFQMNKDENRKIYRGQYNLPDNKIAIGIIGRLVPIKNHQLFLKAINQLKKSNSVSFQAFIIGDGEERNHIESLANQLKLTFDNSPNSEVDIIFTSWIKDVDKALPGLDLIALTSKNEGTPVSLIEAQAAEKAIVSTNVGGIENVVLPGESALLSELTDEDLFCQNLIKLCTNDSLRNEQCKRGKDFVFKNFHYNRLVADTVELYENLLP
ncbi:MAG: glycosyltransferase [Salibacteraceae bacterium]